MHFRPALLLSTMLLTGEALAQDALPEPAVTFTTGASSLSESHGDWTLICGVQDVDKVCVVTQTLGNQQSGQRVVTLEFEANDDGVAGTLMMPFGLRLSEGVRTQVGSVIVGDTAQFSTCYENGCLASFAMDADTTELLKRASELNLIAIAGDSGENVVVTASLKGFTSAMARGQELAQ